MIKQMITDFVEKEVIPYAEEMNHEQIFPYEPIKKAEKLGIMGMSIPKKIWRCRT